MGTVFEHIQMLATRLLVIYQHQAMVTRRILTHLRVIWFRFKSLLLLHLSFWNDCLIRVSYFLSACTTRLIVPSNRVVVVFYLTYPIHSMCHCPSSMTFCDRVYSVKSTIIKCATVQECKVYSSTIICSKEIPRALPNLRCAPVNAQPCEGNHGLS
jgi:hypothetical protein